MTDYIVTGANGFIGAHLVRELLKNPQHRVIALVRKNANCWRLLKNDHLLVYEVNFNDYTEILTHIKAWEPKAIFHLAWEGVTNSYRNDLVQENNFLVLKNLLQLAHDQQIETFVGLGSQAEYGIKNYPITEEEPLEPTTLYGKEKVRACRYTQEFCSKRNIKYMWFRLFSTYGPMDNPQWLIPYTIRELLENREPLLTQGSQVWDYLYVTDVISALLCSQQISNSNIFNLGSGSSISIREVVTMVYHLLGKQQKIRFGTLPFRRDQIMHLQADMKKFFSTYQWKPEVQLDEGLFKTIKFYQS